MINIKKSQLEFIPFLYKWLSVKWSLKISQMFTMSCCCFFWLLITKKGEWKIVTNSRGVYLFCFLSFPLIPSFLASHEFETTHTVDKSTQTLVMNVSVKSNLTSKQKRKRQMLPSLWGRLKWVALACYDLHTTSLCRPWWQMNTVSSASLKIQDLFLLCQTRGHPCLLLAS